MKIVIVGGVAGGASAAARLRRNSEEIEIIMIERGEYISFANCGLPYHIGGEISDRDALLVQTVEGMKNRFNIDIKIKTEVISIDKNNKLVKIKNLLSGEIQDIRYDKLLLSPGANPFIPNIKGLNSSNNVFTLRNMHDMDKIIKHIKENKVKKAAIIGAGFIGLEMAENLTNLNIMSTIIEKSNQVLNNVDFEIAAQLHNHLKEVNVELFLNNGLEEVEDFPNHSLLKLESGDKIEADLIIMAIGIKPETSLAKNAGLEIGSSGGIKVDSYLKTSDENIYAVGDAIEVSSYITGSPAIIPLAWPANRQGRIVADNILGKRLKKYNQSLGTSILKMFDLQVASTGLNEKYLKKHDIDYDVVTVNRNNHAGYYPGAIPLTLKLIFNKDGIILGAQGIGYDGVDKRIDVIATAIQGGLKVWELQELELAYAPPFNSAKDPVNILGYTAENLLNGDLASIRYNELNDYLYNNHSELLDIRTIDEHNLGAIPNSKHIDLNELRSRMNELDKYKTYIVYCQVGLRGYIAYRLLTQNGFKVLNLDGGYKLWSYVNTEQNNIGIFDNKKSFQKVDSSEFIHSEVLVDEELIKKDVKSINACGLQCPGPILKTKETVDSISAGESFTISATDPGFYKDIETWCSKTGHDLIDIKKEKGTITAHIRKNIVNKVRLENPANGQTIVVFSGDLDKVMASLIIANGALAMGKKVSMFFTFWGLNSLRKPTYKTKNKSFIEKAFELMMPKGANRLKISNLNFFGLGTIMMKYVMKNKNINSVESLLETFIQNGGHIIACTMSMDVMGIKKDELIDGIDYGGVATYLGDAEDSNSNLFI